MLCYPLLTCAPLLTVYVVYSAKIILFWDRAFNDEITRATVRSLCRSYTTPFLFIASVYYWKSRTCPELKKFFRDVQPLGVSEHFSFKCGDGSGDSLIIALVGTPLPEKVASLPALDECNVSVCDVLANRFDSHEKLRSEIDRQLSGSLSSDVSGPGSDLGTRSRFKPWWMSPDPKKKRY